VSGFAGSEQAGRRRRRRLAVEVEGSESTESQNSGNGDPLERFFAASGKEAVGLSPRDCPINNLISVQVWKHWVAMLMVLLIGLGLVVAGYTYPQWAHDLGPGLPKLLKLSNSPALAWLNSIVLFVSAQIAAIILWARSRSLRDFGGRYRIWGWTAATWLVVSFSVATQAHQVWSETILHYFPWRAQGAAMWCWLVPASIWGWGLALRLEQDMREDPLGYWVFLFAFLCELGSVALLFQREFWVGSLNAGTQQLLFAVIQLVAHLTLLLSMSLHARYVLFFSAEPPVTRRRTARQSEPAPVVNSLFQRLLPNWIKGVKMPGEGTDEATEEEGSKRGRKRAAPKKKSTARKPSRRSKAAESEIEDGSDTDLSEEESAEAQVSATSPAGKSYRIDKP